MNDSPSFVLPLGDLAVLVASGADALSFLHGQLTQDIRGLPAGQARLAGYCTPKGRLLGSMVAWKQEGADAPALRALVKADLAQALAKRISMFVLRAKVSLQVAATPVYGLQLGQDSGAALTDLPDGLLEGLAGQTEPWSLRQVGGICCVAAPSAGSTRRWWLIPDEGTAIPAADGADDGRLLAAWQAADIAAGLPWVQAATQDTFIPQTLNFDLIDGVSFTKGCYPGQEVVARAHYRGTVKRRMLFGIVDAAAGLDIPALPGVDTYDAHKPDAPCGRVVSAAAQGDGLALLMEAQLADIGQADFRLGSAEGPAIRLGQMPYPVAAQD